MFVAIAVEDRDPDAMVAARFGRAPAFILADSETGEWVAHVNPERYVRYDAGVQLGRFLATHGIQAVIAGNIGNSARKALSSLGIQVCLLPAGQKMSGREALARYSNGELQHA